MERWSELFIALQIDNPGLNKALPICDILCHFHIITVLVVYTRERVHTAHIAYNTNVCVIM